MARAVVENIRKKNTDRSMEQSSDRQSKALRRTIEQKITGNRIKPFEVRRRNG